MGYSALIEPLLEIVPLAPTLPELGRYSALAFTSANGVRAFAALSPERTIPVYAVGDATASVSRELGFGDIRVGGGNAAQLAEAIRKTLAPATRVLHVSGRVVAVDLADALRQSGISADRLPAYEAKPAGSLSESLASALYACTISHVLLFSPRTASIFGTLAVAQGLSARLGSCLALCLSTAVAAEAGRSRWKGIAVAEKPNAESLLELLPRARES
jgi:uroporphyrinogen-III synthase